MGSRTGHRDIVPLVPDRPREEQPAPAQGRLVLLVCVLLIAAQLAFRGWAVLGSWFQFDDVVFISRLYDSLELGPRRRRVRRALHPAGLTLTWLFVRLDPLGFTPYALTLLGLQALASVGFLLLLRSLFGARWGIVPALAVYLFSAITLNAFIWWAAGVNQLTLQGRQVAWGLLCHLAYLRSGRFRWVLATVTVIVVCLTFYEKVLLVYGAIAIVTLAWFTTGGIRQADDRPGVVALPHRPGRARADGAGLHRGLRPVRAHAARHRRQVAARGRAGREHGHQAWLPAMFGPARHAGAAVDQQCERRAHRLLPRQIERLRNAVLEHA